MRKLLLFRNLLRPLVSVLSTAAICALVAGIAVHAVSASPETHPAPFRLFTLTVMGNVLDGADLACTLAAPKHAALIVGREAADGSLVQGPVVIVDLGELGAGVTHVNWDFTVDGELLAPGTYVVAGESLGPFDGTNVDAPGGLFAPNPYQITISVDGYVQAQELGGYRPPPTAASTP